jgi:hypothetical protein
MRYGHDRSPKKSSRGGRREIMMGFYVQQFQANALISWHPGGELHITTYRPKY